MRANEKMLRKYYDDKWRRAIYSVEEVSDLLGIPRPTLYRYLREYSIPHFRKSGRISIPEDSFERIRKARDLHREGMATGSVRRMLRDDEPPVPDTGELSTRMEKLSRELESLRSDSKVLDEASSPRALRTILARQSVLISAVFNLTGMVEELMRAGGHPRREPFEETVVIDDEEAAPLEAARLPETRLARSRPSGSARLPASARSLATTAEGMDGGFGSLARRRRRVAVGVVALLLLAVVVVAALLLFSTGLAGSIVSGRNASPQTEEARPAASISVPDLVGLSPEAAEQRLAEAGLVAGEQARHPGGDADLGKVVAQEPEAGAEVAKNAKVGFTVGSGSAGGGGPPGTTIQGTGGSGVSSQYGGP